MKGAALLLVATAVLGCAATPAPEAEQPPPPVIDVDDDTAGPATAAPDEAPDDQNAAKVRAAEIARALAEIEVQTIGALGGGGTVTDVLAGGDVPADLLDDRAQGVTAGAAGGARLGGGAASAGGGAAGGSAGLSDIGPTSGATTGRPVVRGPTGAVAVKSRVIEGQVASAASVVARMRGRLRRCYEHGQKGDPSLAGTLSLVASIGAKGDVVSVAGGEKSGLKALLPCVKAVIASATFAPPDGGSAAVNIEAIFTKMP